ncbi:hypothetical protein MG290_06700 [Flavobacterium sp. CBA20B-1]|uniref:hypothetical protein n=1 Tax=unclassified Flavobacterium TaxID=196869 RepID=UPI0022252A0C|nr:MULTISPECIES: hypothetical protein [unclassified Flavobacterium]WCM43345.1 hypothetical protein MG290_06700 [Flavobacterium sp. CBA20B-1]
MKNRLAVYFSLFGCITLSAQQTQQSSISSDIKEIQNRQMFTESMLLNSMNQTVGTQITQIGNNNIAQLETQQMQVNQTGDQQLLFYTETSKLQPSNMNIQMQGTNNYMEIYGNNSIMENMSVKVSGNDRSIIIRNYQ